MVMQAPAHLLKKGPSSLSENVLGGIPPGTIPHISIKGNRFSFIDGTGNEVPHEDFNLDVIIVDANPAVSKVYYRDAYNAQEEGKSPTCYSDDGIRPSDQSVEKQNIICATCPLNAWGSAVSKMSGKQLKACTDVKKLVVLVPSFGGEILFLLRVPPASLKNLRAYTNTLRSIVVGNRCAEPSDIYTRISFETQGVLRFTPMPNPGPQGSFIGEEWIPVLERIENAGATKVLLGLGGSEGGIALPPPAPVPARQLPKPEKEAPTSSYVDLVEDRDFLDPPSSPKDPIKKTKAKQSAVEKSPPPMQQLGNPSSALDIDLQAAFDLQLEGE